MGSPRGRACPWWGAQDAERAVERLDAVAEPAQPAALRVGAAAPVVADLDHGVPVRERDVDPRAGGVRVLVDVGQRLGGDVVGGGLDGRGQPLGQSQQTSRRDRGVAGQGGERRLEPFLAEDRWVHAARERAQFLDRALELFVDVGQQRVERLRIARPVAGEPDGEPQAEQRLLGAVVEVALDPAALRVGRGNQPLARVADLVQAGAEVGLQARVLQRELRGCGHRLEQFRILEQCGVVDQRRERFVDVVAQPETRRPSSSRSGLGEPAAST